MHILENLKVWLKSIDLVVSLYEFTVQLPSDEKFGLISQMKRCAVSIPSNIAEGAGRNSQKEFKHFLAIANGSAYELQTQLLLCSKLKLCPSETAQNLIDNCIEIQKMNYAFQKALQ